MSCTQTLGVCRSSRDSIHSVFICFMVCNRKLWQDEVFGNGESGSSIICSDERFLIQTVSSIQKLALTHWLKVERITRHACSARNCLLLWIVWIRRKYFLPSLLEGKIPGALIKHGLQRNQQIFHFHVIILISENMSVAENKNWSKKNWRCRTERAAEHQNHDLNFFLENEP